MLRDSTGIDATPALFTANDFAFQIVRIGVTNVLIVS